MRALFGVMLACGLAQAAPIPPDALRWRATLIRESRAQWGLDAPVASFAAQIHQESRWRAGAVSPVGARGMAQFMPATARWIAGAYPQQLQGADSANPAWAIRALVVYDRHLYQRINALAVCDRFAMALSAYNGGLGWVYRDQKRASAAGLDARRWWGQVERVNAGRSAAAWRENRGYPRMILRHYTPLYQAAGWGNGGCDA